MDSRHASRDSDAEGGKPPPDSGAEATGVEGMVKRTLPAYFRSQRQIIIDAEALLKQRNALDADTFVKRADAIGVDQRILRLRYGQFLGVPMPIWITGVFFVAMAFILSSTKLGRYVYAMGSNEMGARQVGINIRWYKLGVYVVSGLSCALGALVLMARMDSSSGKMAQMFELDAIAAVILGGTSLFGGRGSIWGSLLGAVLITMIRNGMNLMEISQFKQMMAIGAVVIVAVWIDVVRRKHLLKK